LKRGSSWLKKTSGAGILQVCGEDYCRSDFIKRFADPTTKKFLAENCDPVFGFPQLVRFSWSTTTEVLKEAYHVDYETAEEDVTPASNTSITSFFKITPKSGSGGKGLHDFFKRRCLSRKVEL
jgi:ribonuclease H2 subunit A